MENKKGNNKFKDANLRSRIFCYPLFFGIIAKQEKNEVNCQVVKKNGEIKLCSQRVKTKPICHIDAPLLRGLEFVIYGLWLYLKIIFNSFNNYYFVFKSQKTLKDVLKIIILTICCTMAIIVLVLFIGWFWLGVLPAQLSFWIFPNSHSIMLKKVTSGIIRIVFVYILLVSLSGITVVKNLLRFNTACNISAYGKNFCAVNFLNVLFASLLVHTFVISLISISISFVAMILLRIFIIIVVVAMVFEVCLFLEKLDSKITKLCVVTSIVFYAKPGKTELQVASGAIMECKLMKNEQREMLDGAKQHGEIELAFVLANVTEALKNGGIVEPSESLWLVASVLGVKKYDLKFIKFITLMQYQRIQNALERRLKHEPIDKIFGFTEFYGLKFKVNKSVLTPRQETELLVEEILKIANSNSKILDLCTGSGAIAVSVMKNCGGVVYATDISESALEVAIHNAKTNEVNIKFKQSDMFSALKRKKFDIIVSNPPYIKTEEIALLDREVKNFDPTLALDGGADGLYFYRIIAQDAPAHLMSNGKLFLEIGQNQANKVKKLLTENFKDIKILKDYNGIQRIVVATKKD